MKLRPILERAWKIYAVCDSRGDCQLAEFIAELPSNLSKDGDRLLALFEHVGERGPQHLPAERCHTLAPDIWEFICGRLRVAWFYDEGRMIVCSHGFIKKSQKTKRQDVELAVRARGSYFADKTAGKIYVIKED